MRYALLIPARDEEATLPALFERLRLSVTAPGEIVVVDNGSRDGTAAVARAAGATVVEEPRTGYGRACLRGISHLRAAPPDVLVFLDADDFRAPAQLPRLLSPLRQGRADLAIGERHAGAGGGVRRHARLGNALVLTVLRGLYGSTVRDMGPFRAIRWEALERLALDDTAYGWYVQMQVRAERLGLRVTGVPVVFERRTAGRSKVSGSFRASLAAGTGMLGTLIAEALRPDPDRAPYGAAAPPDPPRPTAGAGRGSGE